MEAEIGVRLPQAKEHMGSQDLKEVRKDASLCPCQHLDFELLTSEL